MRYCLGIDISEEYLDKPRLQTIKEAGFEVVIQCLWTGGDARNKQINKVAEPNLYNTADFGLGFAAYSNASPYFPGRSLEETVKNAGSMWDHLKVCATDCEIWDPPYIMTEEILHNHIAETIALEKDTCLYTARWFWQDKFGNPKWEWLKLLRLWNAYYDFNPDIDFPSNPYGPWEPSAICAEQYSDLGSVVLGFDADLNILDKDFWLPGQQSQPQHQEVPNMLLIQVDSPKAPVFEVSGGKLFHIPNPETLDALRKLGVAVTTVKPDHPLLKLPVEFNYIPGEILS